MIVGRASSSTQRLKVGVVWTDARDSLVGKEAVWRKVKAVESGRAQKGWKESSSRGKRESSGDFGMGHEGSLHRGRTSVAAMTLVETSAEAQLRRNRLDVVDADVMEGAQEEQWRQLGLVKQLSQIGVQRVQQGNEFAEPDRMK